MWASPAATAAAPATDVERGSGGHDRGELVTAGLVVGIGSDPSKRPALLRYTSPEGRGDIWDGR